MSKRSDELRNKYIKNPPEGITTDDGQGKTPWTETNRNIINPINISRL